MGAGKVGKTLGSGNFHLGEVPGMGAGVPDWPHPTPWPQEMWAQGRKWVRAGLELNPIGPMTSLPVTEEAQPQRSLLPPPKSPQSLFFRKEETWIPGVWAEGTGRPPIPTPSRRQSRDNPLTSGWRFCTKQTVTPTHMVTGTHLEHSPHTLGNYGGRHAPPSRSRTG